MADHFQLSMLLRGTEKWNQWRKTYLRAGEPPDLTRADLRGTDLRSANLYRANLSGADLSKADLRKADLGEADLSGANLSGADLREAILRTTFCFQTNFSAANLIGADLHGIYIAGANLLGANCRQVWRHQGRHYRTLGFSPPRCNPVTWRRMRLADKNTAQSIVACRMVLRTRSTSTLDKDDLLRRQKYPRPRNQARIRRLRSRVMFRRLTRFKSRR